MRRKKLTKEDVNNRLSSRGIVLLGEYIDSDTKTLFQCSKGHTWEAAPTNLIHGRSRKGCPYCAGKVPLTKEIVNERLADLGIVMLGDYVNSHTKSLFKNKEGHTWEATPANVLASNDRQQRTGSRLTKEIVNERLADRGIVMLDEYVHQKVKARFQCSQGHIWPARPNNVLSGKGCRTCGKVSAANKQRLTVDVVRNRLAGRGIDLVGEYVDSQTITQFKCNEGHTWETTPNSVMGGSGCPYCYGKNLPLTKDIVNARIADRGITMLGDYMGAHVDALFQCSEGHAWEARPASILNSGRNCPHCAGQFPLSNEIVNERIADRGLVMQGEYVNNSTKILFQCSEGHTWEASPANVVAGTGCPYCAGNIPLTTEIVNDRIADRGIVMLDEYINNSTNRRFQCSEGHVWETQPACVLSGTGCPTCAETFSDNDVFYLWIAGPQEMVPLRDGEFLLKYGVTSERREDLRIKEIGWKWNTAPKVLAVVKTKVPAIWAEKAAARIGQRLTSGCSHLDGWTEFRIVNDTELAQLMAIADEAAEYKIVWNDLVSHIEEYHLEQLKFDLQL